MILLPITSHIPVMPIMPLIRKTVMPIRGVIGTTVMLIASVSFISNSSGYFAIKFDLLMFSNTFDTISTFTVELKVLFLLFIKTTTK